MKNDRESLDGARITCHARGDKARLNLVAYVLVPGTMDRNIVRFQQDHRSRRRVNAALCPGLCGPI